MSAGVVLEVASLGVRGDGIAEHEGERVFLPFTLPGDRVRARLGPRHGDGRAGTVLSFEVEAPRAEPRCPHYGLCGGCALQHVPAEIYAASKQAWLEVALTRHGLREAPIGPIRLLPPGTRRRARLSLQRAGAAVEAGFQARGSHRIVDMRACDVLHPRLVALVAPLRRLAGHILAPGAAAAATMTLVETGIDLLLDLAREPDLAALETLAEFARAEDLARLAWRVRGERPVPVAQHRPVRVTMGGVAIELPYDAFLQASAEADVALVEAVVAAAAGARRVADLFAGVGTFTFPLVSFAAVHAVEGDDAALAALKAAAARAGLGARVTAEARDLAARPLDPAELAKFDCVVFDPPRAGAMAQARALAASSVPHVVAVSCNPATFARDAKILVAGGFRLTGIAPFDSFIWSPHLELVAAFMRG
ncbi:MAG TPA: 23S rRNA (uracil(1939)-C(5))-methyltransferase RlmD [Stellaceae bacterium]|nr:23S rRNA (uracil(1939)-C(5))-methyltransferase RlmD [Stellaceae bacterium]